ncbi:hypothetical protein KIL84_006617 [Mauremys mutica]|uniref:Uncharacterized protein n=1 Tax=Mauremys mutica TaxID=74926 RepID=A0A9D4AUQ6_9SAUR|nr:hypothetical protein KIL84_006617 [Mauremys mutica]
MHPSLPSKRSRIHIAGHGHPHQDSHAQPPPSTGVSHVENTLAAQRQLSPLWEFAAEAELLSGDKGISQAHTQPSPLSPSLPAFPLPVTVAPDLWLRNKHKVLDSGKWARAFQSGPSANHQPELPLRPVQLPVRENSPSLPTALPATHTPRASLR